LTFLPYPVCLGKRRNVSAHPLRAPWKPNTSSDSIFPWPWCAEGGMSPKDVPKGRPQRISERMCPKAGPKGRTRRMSPKDIPGGYLSPEDVPKGCPHPRCHERMFPKGVRKGWSRSTSPKNVAKGYPQRMSPKDVPKGSPQRMSPEDIPILEYVLYLIFRFE